MKLSDLTSQSKLAVGLAIAGFVLSFHVTSTSTSGGVYTCSFVDYGKLIFGALAIIVGGLGTVAATRLGETRGINMAACGGAALAGVLAVLLGLGIVGGPC